jgi:hypothetical protein
MKKYLFYIIRFVYKPSTTLQDIIAEERIGFSFFIVVINGLCASGATLFYPKKFINTSIAFDHYMPFLLPLVSLLLWVVCAGILHISSKRFKGKGNYKSMLIGIGTVCLILIIKELIYFLLLSSLEFKIPKPIQTIFNLIFNLWFIVALLIAIKTVQKFSILKSIGAIVLPIFYIFSITILIILSWKILFS